jgi:adenylate cyclase class IV
MDKKSSVTFKKLDKSSKIQDEHEVRVTVMNHIVEVFSLSRQRG